MTKSFFKELFGEKSSVESGDEDAIAIRVRNFGEPFFIEIDLERSVRTEWRYFFRYNKTTRCSHSKWQRR